MGVEVKDGVVIAQVTVDIGGGNTIASSITLNSARNLGLAAGKKMTASDMMLGV